MDRLRLLTPNIWNRQGPWEARLGIIRRRLAALAPDVVALQEVLRHDALPPDQAEVIADGLGYHVVYGTAWDIGGGLRFGNAILSRFPVARSANFVLPGPSGRETRAALFAELDAPAGLVPVFSTHLDWQFHQGVVRIGQVDFLAHKVAELAPVGDGFPPVLMGDFNAEPEADEIRFLRGYTPLGGRSVYFADCYACAGEGPGYTYARANRFAARTYEPNRRIDYIFVRGPDRRLRGEPLLARLELTEPEDGVFASDHYAVYAEIQASPRSVVDV